MLAILDNLTPELSDRLKQRIAAKLSKIVNTNSTTIYYNEAPLLSRFRSQYNTFSVVSYDDGNKVDDYKLLELFTSMVPLSEYTDYLPFVSRFFENPCRASRITNLLAPGVPQYIAHSSGTSGGVAKTFPKYLHKPARAGMENSDGEPECILLNARYRQIIDVLDDTGDEITKRLLVSLVSSAALREQHPGFSVDADESLMNKRVPARNTAPFAVAMTHDYRTYLVLHALFALMEPRLAVISTTFTTLLHDFVRLLVKHWETLLQAIENGKLPALDGVEDSRPYLQDLLTPDPSRAAALRTIDIGTEGWFCRVWPNLRRINAIVGGSFSNVVPKLRHHLGPKVEIHSLGYGCTEVSIAFKYDIEQIDMFKVWDNDFIEYLDTERQESAGELSQAWNLQPGRKYEPVVTTRDGLWRYRFGDVLQAVGFDPTDGQPILRYVGRRNMSIRIYGTLLTEENLTDAIHSLKDVIGKVTEFTVFEDNRKIPSSCGYFVELDSPHLRLIATGATSLLHVHLAQTSESYRINAAIGRMGIPSIHVVAPETFREYREWRVDIAGSGSGQIKVPSVVHNDEAKEWFMQRVVYEI